MGKPAAAFCSVATQGGGIETTIMTALTQFTHHGMIFVPPGAALLPPGLGGSRHLTLRMPALVRR